MNGPVFLDTVGLLAIWNRRDQWHNAATGAFAELARRRVRLITTSYILLECGNAAARQAFRGLVIALRDELRSADNLIEPTDEDCDLAWTAYALGDANNAGVVDQVSFAVMRRLGAQQALTNDRHYEAAGFEILF